MLWLLERVGLTPSKEEFQRSFGLRWFINSSNFLLTWGVSVLIIWTVLGNPNVLRVGVLCVIVGSAIYGALVSSTETKLEGLRGGKKQP